MSGGGGGGGGQSKAQDMRGLQQEVMTLKEMTQLQEMEIQGLSAEIDVLKNKYHALSVKHGTEMRRVTEERMRMESENREMREKMEGMKESKAMSQAMYKTLVRDQKALKSRVFELTEDLMTALRQVNHCNLVEEENVKLQQFTLTLSELYQQAIDGQDTVSHSVPHKPDESWMELDMLLQASRRDSDRLKYRLKDCQRELELSKARTQGLEVELRAKEAVVGQVTGTMEGLKRRHRLDIQAKETQNRVLVQVMVCLEQRILGLYSEMGLKEHEKEIFECSRQMIIRREADSEQKPTFPLFFDQHND
jgi:hypothetical protein